MRKCVGAALAAAALAAVPSGAAAQEVAGQAIEGQYIVVLKDSANAETAKTRVRDRGGRVQRDFGRALKGFSAKLDAKALAAVKADSAVDYVEQDRVVTADATQSPATWGLDRIDQRALPLSNSYMYSTTAGNVRAYIIDTGIRFSHTDFGGRATSGYDAVDGGSADDCNGHGTHVAGTVGGSTYGVAKGVRLVAVRVLGCTGSGSTSGVIAGVNWVTSNAIKPAVANMSLGGGISSALDTAVANSINSGVTYAVAAGNSNANACNSSPARVSTALTVGATGSSDARASFSNYGSCLDLFAPGQSITSDWYTSNTQTNTISGTSMASPHVAGAAALVASANPAWTAAQVASSIKSNATQNPVTGAGTGSPNLLLYTGTGGTQPPPPPPPDSGACTTTTLTGSLSGTGANWYSTPCSLNGFVSGTLSGPSGVDFDLYLQRQTSTGSWTTVASSLGVTASESISGTASAGVYRWRVYAYSGSGTFTLRVTTQ